ncbi:hypothetical protein F4677DRAFT_447156 [Hypoxylon crocopeplum]|nr:hypothetical protein F4677DRAFT_447156 [Hypoxylon crocopeplum]
MALKLHEVTSEEEFRLVVDVEHEAYGNPFNGVWEITKGSSPEECTARQFSWHKAEPGSHWVYVTDEATGDVIGGTQWIIHETNPFAKEQPEKTIYWLPEGPAKEIGNQLLRDLGKHRPGIMSKPHLLISYCFVHSAHRNRGAASLMLQWGTKKADELGLDAFVESTEMARSAYEKHGFYVIGDLNMDAQLENPTEEFTAMRQHLGCPIHGWVMKRDAVSTQ